MVIKNLYKCVNMALMLLAQSLCVGEQKIMKHE